MQEQKVLTPDQAVSLVSLLEKKVRTASFDLSEESYNAVDLAFGIRDRLREILYNRALGQTGALISQSYAVKDYNERRVSAMPFDAYKGDSFIWGVDSVSAEYQVNAVYRDGYGEPIGIYSNELSTIADMMSMFGYEEATEICDDDIVEFFEYLTEMTFDEDEVEKILSRKSEVVDILDSLEKYKTDSMMSELLIDVIKDVKKSLEKIIGKSLSFVSNEDILKYLDIIILNFYTSDYDKTSHIFFNLDIPKVYLHREDFLDTKYKDALIKAIDYFIDLDIEDAPCSKNFAQMREDYLILFLTFGGFGGSGYCVEDGHMPPWWDLSIQIIDALLPVVLKNQK